MDLALLTSESQSVIFGGQIQGDLDFSSGDLRLVSGADFARQQVQIRLQFFLGEWFLDLNEGMPYFQNILVKSPDASVIDDIFRQAIIEANSIKSIVSLTFSYEPAVRSLSVACSAIIQDEEDIVPFDQEFVINV